MIDWVDELARVWAPVHKRILFGQDLGRWPSRSVMGRIRDEWGSFGGSNNTRPKQDFPEVYLGDALLLQRAVREPFPMDWDLYCTLVVHYCLPSKVKEKPEQLRVLIGLEEEVKYREYWQYMDRAHHFLSGRIRTRRTGS